MQRIRISQITLGQQFDASLFLPSGQKLIGPNVPITQSHINALYRCGEAELILADTLEEMVEEGILSSARSGDLRVGAKASRAFISSGGQTVVEAGEVIEQHHVDALRQSGSMYAGSEAGGSTGGGAGRRELLLLSEELCEDLIARIPGMTLRVHPVQARWQKPADPATCPTLEQWGVMRLTAVERLRMQYARIEAGMNADRAEFDHILDELMRHLTRHSSRFAQLALLCERQADHLPDHAYTVAVLAMAMAAHLNWPAEHVKEIGLAGLTMDVGMLLVPERIRIGACRLTDLDRDRVQRHPMYSLAMLRFVPNLSDAVRVAALQHHERENGTGYPFAKRRNDMHDYARVLAVADAYAATTEPRTYRKPKLPYQSMEETLRCAAAQIFWPPAVRALLNAAGLFPVGSYVLLSNGRTARILACNPDKIDRPLILPLREGVPENVAVDLSDLPKEELAVVRPVPAPAPLAATV